MNLRQARKIIGGDLSWKWRVHRVGTEDRARAVVAHHAWRQRGSEILMVICSKREQRRSRARREGTP